METLTVNTYKADGKAYYYSVVTENGRLIASCVDHGMAKQIAQLPQLVALRADWASIINRLAHIALDGGDSNDRDFCEDMIDMVRSYLESEHE